MSQELLNLFAGEHKTTLSESTIKKAKSLSKKIQLEDQSWLVQSGSKNGWYVVKYDENKNWLWCSNGIDSSVCDGWKFKKECKHCLAVRILNGQTVNHAEK